MTADDQIDSTPAVDSLDPDDLTPLKKGASEARVSYESEIGLYEDFARSVAAILGQCAFSEDLIFHSITHRAKTPESFERKAARPSPENPHEPKYKDPLTQITDKAGVRVITYFLSTLDAISSVIAREFDVVERLRKVSDQPDRLGYQSIHYLIKLNDTRTSLAEYRRFRNITAEVQVRTILQHAWAEIEHDIQYKAVAALPSRVRRRFAALAGLIEIADREFQAIEDEDRALRAEARRKVDLGQLDQVEITSDSIRAYLDRKYGPDGRMSKFTYDWTARLLQRLGFSNLAEVDECVGQYNDSEISRILYGGRQGQATRFEDVLMASMAEGYFARHPWTNSDWFTGYYGGKLEKLRSAGVPIGSYRPPGWQAEPSA